MDIITVAPSVYYLRLLSSDEEIELTVYKGNCLVKEYHFIVDESIPMPKIDINGGKAMERGTILTDKVDSVFCRPVLTDNYNKSLSFSVIAFTVTLKRGENILFSKSVEGNKFPDDQVVFQRKQH